MQVEKIGIAQGKATSNTQRVSVNNDDQLFEDQISVTGNQVNTFNITLYKVTYENFSRHDSAVRKGSWV